MVSPYLDLLVSLSLVLLATLVVPLVSVYAGGGTPVSIDPTAGTRGSSSAVHLSRLSRREIPLTPFQASPTKVVIKAHRFLVVHKGHRFYAHVPNVEHVVSNGKTTYASTKDGVVYRFEGDQAVDRYHASGMVVALLADPELSHVFVQETTQVVEATQGWQVVTAFDRPVQCHLGQEGLVVVDRQVWALYRETSFSEPVHSSDLVDNVQARTGDV